MQKQLSVVKSRTEQVTLFYTGGTDVLYEYDPAIVSMEEVNSVINRLEREHGGKAFSLSSGEVIDKATAETRNVTILRPLAGG